MRSAGRGNPGLSCFLPTCRDTATPRSRAKSPPTGPGLWIRTSTNVRASRCAWRWSIRTSLPRKATVSCWSSWRPRDGRMRLSPPSPTGCLATSCSRRCAPLGKPMEGPRSWHFRPKPERVKRNCGARFALLWRNFPRSKVFPQSSDPIKSSILLEALVDPHIEQPGSSPDSSKGEDGGNYLRRPKGEPAEGAPADAAAKGAGRNPEAAATAALKERRQSPRLRCSGSVEFRAEGNNARKWGTLTDVSLHGCYVEM